MTATFEIQDALMNPKSLAMQSGVEVSNDPQEIHNREVVSNDGGSVTLSHAPTGEVRLYATQDGYNMDAETVEVVTPATEGDNTVTTTLTTENVIAFYIYEKTDNIEKFTIRSDRFSGFYKVVASTTATNFETKEEEGWQIVIPQAKISSAWELSLEAEGDPSVFDMSLDIFKPDESTEMVHFIKY